MRWAGVRQKQHQNGCQSVTKPSHAPRHYRRHRSKAAESTSLQQQRPEIGSPKQTSVCFWGSLSPYTKLRTTWLYRWGNGIILRCISASLTLLPPPPPFPAHPKHTGQTEKPGCCTDGAGDALYNRDGLFWPNSVSEWRRGGCLTQNHQNNAILSCGFHKFNAFTTGNPSFYKIT